MAASAAGVGDMLSLASLGVAIVVLVLRYRRSTGEARQQLKWVVWAGSITAIEVATEFLPGNRVATWTGPAVVLLLSTAIAIAVVRHQLFEIDVVIHHTLVHAVLTLALGGGYLGLVALSGALLAQPVHLGRGLAVTVLIAIGLSPLRQWLQRMVTRLIYGQRQNPYRVMAELGQRIETSDRRAELSVVVDTVTQALKLPYAAIVGLDGKVLAATGQARGQPVSQPLGYQGEPVGTLLTRAADTGRQVRPR